MFSSRKNSANSREYQLNPKSGNERYSVFQIFPPNLVTLEWPELQTSDPNYQLTRITPSYPISSREKLVSYNNIETTTHPVSS